MKQALTGSRAAWLISEWGAGSHQFIWSVFERNARIFRLDLHAYGSREVFLSEIKRQLDFTLEQFCTAIADAGTATLMLDDVPVSASLVEGVQAIETDIEATG